ncbi:MAG: Fe-S-containing hydro-lyase [Carboxydocellales bacterium]
MSEIIRVNSPLTAEAIEQLTIGARVLISGFVYTARDTAHKKLLELLNEGRPLPIDLRGQIIYYAGPTPPKPGKVIGSVGPTTSGRMDAFTPRLLEQGLKGMIGKGLRSQEVVNSIKKNQAVYFVAIGGTAALISKHIKACEVVAYPELGTEAIRRLLVEDFPAIVATDMYGGNLYC